MTESEQNQDGLRETPCQTKSVQLPVGYFVLPLFLSFWVPVAALAAICVPIAMITDPIRPQGPDGGMWIDIVYTAILFIGFVGMCCRKEWALWLTVISRLISSLMQANAIFLTGPHKFLPVWCIFLLYDLLITTSCCYALWQCWRYRRRIQWN